MRIEPRVHDQEEADRCELWYQSEQGQFALGAQRGMLERMMSAWPRRQQTLLEIDCGPGFLLDFFHQAGFDVTAIESCPELLAKARSRAEAHIDLHLGQPEHLPFEDREFDYCALISGLDFSPQPARAILEAARVAKKGILVGFFNRYSLTYSLRRFFSATRLYPFYRARWFSPWSLHSLLVESTGHHSIYMRGLLPAPVCTWKNRAPWRQLNSSLLPWFIGTLCLARVNFMDEAPLTPLMALAKKSFAKKQEQAGCLNTTGGNDSKTSVG